MARGKVLFKNPQEGDIKIMPSNPNAKWRYTNGEWVYVKKPKGYFKKDQPKPEKPKVIFPPVTLPDHMRETLYPGYYVTEEGDVYRKPVKGERMTIGENGLVYLKPGRRGHVKYPEKQYDCVNITIRDEDGKFVKQFTKSNHQLVAETFVDNPHNYTEIMHMDENPRNNHYTNLKWGTHVENMEGVISPCTTPKSYKITDTRTGKIWKGINMGTWVREHHDFIVSRMKKSERSVQAINRHLSNARSKGCRIWGFIVEY